MPERVAVSTSTFIDLSHPVSDGLKITKGLIEGGLYAPEIGQAIQTAKEFGLGLEIAYRVGLSRAVDKIKESGVYIYQLHGPVVWSAREAVSEAVGTNNDSSLKVKLKGVVMGVGMAKLANGTISTDWEETKRLTRELGAKSIVLHPNGAEILYKNRGMIFGSDDQLVVGIEPDFKRMTEKPGVIWNPDEVVRIAEMTEQGVLLDTSHTGITYNSVQDMFRLYEKFKKEVKKGVVAIHFSVAVPGESREEFFTKGTGARPLYQDTPDWVKGAYREFYQEVTRDQDFKGPIVFEMWSFPKGNTMNDRRKAVGETLEGLEGSSTLKRTYR